MVFFCRMFVVYVSIVVLFFLKKKLFFKMDIFSLRVSLFLIDFDQCFLKVDVCVNIVYVWKRVFYLIFEYNYFIK